MRAKVKKLKDHFFERVGSRTKMLKNTALMYGIAQKTLLKIALLNSYPTTGGFATALGEASSFIC